MSPYLRGSRYAILGSNSTEVTVPTNLQASTGYTGVILSWDASAGFPTIVYHVGRSTVSGGPYTDIGNTSSVAYIDTTGTPGTLYYYVIFATNGGPDSDYSNEASAKRTLTKLMRHPIGPLGLVLGI